MLVTISTNNIKMAKKNFLLLQNSVGISNSKVYGNLVFNDGSKGLSEIYNQAVKLFPKEEEYLFVHHDVEMQTDDWYDKIVDMKECGCDIIGVAGTSNFDLNDGRWWFQNGIPQFNDCHGKVIHTDDVKSWETNFGPSPAENLDVVDGLFLFVTKNIFDAGIKFDERFKFHFYDVSFCIRAKKMGFKIGVADVLVKHLSIGEMDSLYEESRKLFLQCYS